MDTDRPQWPERMSRKEASAYLLKAHGLKYSPPTLANAASRGDGPSYRKQGRRLTIYDRAELDAFARKRLSNPVHSAAELQTV